MCLGLHENDLKHRIAFTVLREAPTLIPESVLRAALVRKEFRDQCFRSEGVAGVAG